MLLFGSGIHEFRCPVDGLADTLVCSAPAKVTLHGGVNICIRRLWFCFQQGHRAHDLSALAIPALGNLEFNPCFLHCMIYIFRNSFNVFRYLFV